MNSYKNGMQDQMAIQTFVDKLIEERKDPEVTAANMPVVRSLLIKKVNEAINEHFISLLNDSDVEELDKLLEADIPDGELNEFFRKKIQNISVEVATALLNFRAAYLYPVWKKQQEEQNKVVPTEKTDANNEKQNVDHLPPAPVA